MTINSPNITNFEGLVNNSNSLTNGLAVPLVLAVIFFGSLIALRRSRISISLSSLLTMLLSLICQSLGWVEPYMTTIWLTVFAVSFVYSLVSN